METETVPPIQQTDSVRGEDEPTPPALENETEKNTVSQNVAKNIVKKIEIKFLKAVDPANLNGAGSSTDNPPKPWRWRRGILQTERWRITLWT